MIAAARQDNDGMLLDVFEQGDYDINYQDGCVLVLLVALQLDLICAPLCSLGNTGMALHIVIS